MQNAELIEIAERQHDDRALIPTVIEIESRLTLRGHAKSLRALFERGASVAPPRDVAPDAAYAALEVFPAQAGSAAYARVTAADGAGQTVSVVGGPITAVQPGTALLPMKEIATCLANGADEPVSLDVVGSRVTLLVGRFRHEFETPVRRHTPEIPSVEGIPRHEVKAKPLLKAIQIALAAADHGAQFNWTSLLLVRGGRITGFDTARLHQQRIPGFPADLDFTITQPTANQLIRALKAYDGSHIRVGASDSYLVFEIDEDYIVVQRHTTRYQDVSITVREAGLKNTNELVIERAELIRSVERVRVTADPDLPEVVLDVRPASNGDWVVHLTAQNRVGSLSEDELPCSYTGRKPTTLRVHYRHLIDLLNCPIGNQDATLLLADGGKNQRPVIFAENETYGFTGLVAQIGVGSGR